MIEEKSCWICRRTESEVLQQAVEDGMTSYIGGLSETRSMFGEKKYKKFICPTCSYIMEQKVHEIVKSMIESDALKLYIEPTWG